jgi:hypothetical protein
MRWANLSSVDTNDLSDVSALRIMPHIYSYARRNRQAGHNCGALPCATRTPAFTPTIANPQLLRQGLSVSAHRLRHRSADEHRLSAVGELSSGLDILWSHCVSWPSTRGASGSGDEPDRHLDDQPKRARGPESLAAAVVLVNRARDTVRANAEQIQALDLSELLGPRVYTSNARNHWSFGFGALRQLMASTRLRT